MLRWLIGRRLAALARGGLALLVIEHNMPFLMALAHRIACLDRGRIIAEPDEVIAGAPDIIFGSWCGKRFNPETVAARPGWQGVPAIRDGECHEVKSPLILQPGPAALTDGLDVIHRAIVRWAARRSRA